MNTEIIKLLLTAVLTPILTTILTLPTLFSKTYIQTFITNPFSFSKSTTLEYTKHFLLISGVISMIWTIIVALATLVVTEATQQLSQSLLSLLLIIAATYVILISTKTTTIQSKLLNDTEFSPSKRKHTVILFTLTSIHMIVFTISFFLVFFFL